MESKSGAILLSLRRQVQNRTVPPVHFAHSFACVPPCSPTCHESRSRQAVLADKSH